jgi:hypothetical protein
MEATIVSCVGGCGRTAPEGHFDYCPTCDAHICGIGPCECPCPIEFDNDRERLEFKQLI